MKSFKFILFFSLILIFSCKNELQTPEQFSEQILKFAAEKNENALFNKCYVSTKSEITKMYKEMTNKVDPSDVKDAYKAIQEDKKRILRKFEVLQLESYDAVQIDSVVPKMQKKPGFGGEIEFSNGYRAAEINVFLTHKDDRFRMRLRSLDMNTGKWKLIDHPRIFRLYD